MRKLFPYPWYLSFWLWWLAFTVVYVGLSGVLGLSRAGTALGYLTGLIGLFVPVGILSFTFAKSVPIGFVVFGIIILALIFADLLARRFRIPPNRKIFFNLAALFALTLLADLMLYRTWPSLVIFLEGGISVTPTIL